MQNPRKNHKKHKLIQSYKCLTHHILILQKLCKIKQKMFLIKDSPLFSLQVYMKTQFNTFTLHILAFFNQHEYLECLLSFLRITVV